MSRSRILSSIAAASLSIAMLGACSTEALTERAASFGLEQALEGDQDIDLDFGSDGGGFSISTDEGDFALNFDEDNGGIVFNTDEGDGVITFDENGIVFDTDGGDGVISFDEENGTIDFDTSEGDGSINFDENGNLTIETEDGQFGASTSTDVPASWPQEFVLPATLVAGSSNFSVVDFGSGVVTTGTFSHDPSEPYTGRLVASLVSNGWTELSSITENGSVFAQYTKGDLAALITGDEAGNSSVVLSPMQ